MTASTYRETELQVKMTGIFAPVSTPFSADEEVDYDALRFNLARYATSGVRGYVALGTNGENRSLTEPERLRVLETIVANKGAGQTVMAGAAYEAQRDTERFLARAAAAGADFALVLPPAGFGKQTTDDVLFRYFSTLADFSPIPLMLYNPRSGVRLTRELVTRLADHPNVVGMKDSTSSDIERFLEFESAMFHVLPGSADTLAAGVAKGAIGGVVSLANSFPDLVLHLFACLRVGDRQAVAPIRDRVTRANRATSGRHGVAGVKAAMNLAGFRAGIPRRPLLPLAPAELDILRSALAAEGLLS